MAWRTVFRNRTTHALMPYPAARDAANERGEERQPRPPPVAGDDGRYALDLGGGSVAFYRELDRPTSGSDPNGLLVTWQPEAGRMRFRIQVFHYDASPRGVHDGDARPLLIREAEHRALPGECVITAGIGFEIGFGSRRPE